MKRLALIAVLCLLSTGSVFADEIQLHCEGPTTSTWYGIEQKPSTVSLVVSLDTQKQHMKVQWGANVLIDDKMEVKINSYAHTKYKGNNILRTFGVDRSNLQYVLLITDYIPATEGPYIIKSSGQCKKFAPKI